MTKKILTILIISLSIFISSCKKDDSNNVEYHPGFKAVSFVNGINCPGTPEDISNDDVLISFVDYSYRPKANTWYKTEGTTGVLWYKTGSNVSVVNTPVSYGGLLNTEYTAHCR